MPVLATILSNQIIDWGYAGFPALLERFCMKHGEQFDGAKRPKGVRKQQAKMCFRNAARYADSVAGMKYYEGYAMHRDIAFPFLHAWNVKDDNVIDVTLPEPQYYEYVGLDLTKYLHRELLLNQVYGLLDPGIINLDLLREIDDGLVEEALQVRVRHSGRPTQSRIHR